MKLEVNFYNEEGEKMCFSNFSNFADLKGKTIIISNEYDEMSKQMVLNDFKGVVKYIPNIKDKDK